MIEKCKKREYTNGKDVLKYRDSKSQITDLAGVRVVYYLPQDIPPIQRIIKNIFKIDYKNSMDKSNEVGMNTVGQKFKSMKCEIQLRTVLQDAWSQVFHYHQYKNNAKNGKIPEKILRETNLISDAL